MDEYIVFPGDTLWDIAGRRLGDPSRWREIARLNWIHAPFKIMIGERLRLPPSRPFSLRLRSEPAGRDGPSTWAPAAWGSGRQLPRGGLPAPGAPRGLAAFVRQVSAPISVGTTQRPAEQGASVHMARAFLFILADEVLPSGKVVRKVLVVPPTTTAQAIVANPEIYGIRPVNPRSPVTLGEHALGNTNSRFTSASTLRGGAPNIQGRPVFIDIAKAEAAGVTIHSTEEIIGDLDRIARAKPQMSGRISRLKWVVTHVEREILLEGDIPARAIKSQASMRLTQGVRFVQFVGMAFTAYDLSRATVRSVETESPRPLAAEGIRQIGGWGAAWAGFKAGGAGGALLGLETGPGAIVSGLVGALVFGAAGYFGADWIADLIEEG